MTTTIPAARLQQAERLKAYLTMHKWNLSRCKFAGEIFISAGLPESEVVRVTREVYADWLTVRPDEEREGGEVTE